MKTIGIILSLLIIFLVGIMPVICINSLPDPENVFIAWYLATFLALNLFASIFYAADFNNWFRSNLKDEQAK